MWFFITRFGDTKWGHTHTPDLDRCDTSGTAHHLPKRRTMISKQEYYAWLVDKRSSHCT